MEFLNNAADNATFYAGLQGLYALSIKYEFQQTKPNQPLHSVIKEALRVLSFRINGIISHKELLNTKTNALALRIIYTICMIFSKCNISGE